MKWGLVSFEALRSDSKKIEGFYKADIAFGVSFNIYIFF